jgi:acetylornithine deacetylase
VVVIDVVQLLSELVAIDSVSARPNLPMVDRLAQELGRLSFKLRVLPYVDDAGVEKHNLVASAGPEGPGGLAFVGHTDTVPYDPAWKEALQLTAKDGNLYARGAADTKGFIAAVIAALADLDLRRLRAPLLCIFTADEEVGCVGAKKLVELGAARPAHAIVGEPTQLVPVRAHKGYCLAEVEVLGQEGHSAYPGLGRSAILDAGRLLTRITQLARELEGEGDPLFEPPFTTVNVGTIVGGKARNVIPGRCAFPLEWRPVPGQPTDRVPGLLAAAIAELRAELPGFEARFTVTRRDGGVSVAPDAPVVRFLEAETGHASVTIPFGTELPQLTELGAQGCVCGPGDIRVAHRTGEFVPEADLARAVAIYRRAVEHFTFRG